MGEIFEADMSPLEHSKFFALKGIHCLPAFQTKKHRDKTATRSKLDPGVVHH